eukprot:TRINITY_DN49191_c0_g1_i1.p1 TRINITY_DN49191_c0_g1~~TRINITY_DN49191_c0_g1_i1.p1  ORF type:complete len:400 (+),score=48.88 TRINITY_DN49191_c0_g1_i1:89-1201(+)
MLGGIFGQGSWYHLIKVGSKLSPLECMMVYLLPIGFMLSSRFQSWFFWNAICQLALFLPVVVLPAFITGKMAYVDIGWPGGLVLLAINGLLYGEGYWVRRWVVCGFLFAHGLRMFLGALVMFYPYRFKEDLPRYRHAKERFVGRDGMSPKLWTLKVQHDVLQQAFANMCFLACPVVLCAFDETQYISLAEVLGWSMWVLSFVWENVADGQKELFLAECRRKRREATDEAARESLRTVVLGYAPFDGAKYKLWTLCRHPNYFGEWMCWNGFVVAAVPSLSRLDEPLHIVLVLGLTLFFVSRIFYDCLLYWTGSEPAEAFSVNKRPQYKEYQAKTRVFFPFEMPLVDHCRIAGWPHVTTKDGDGVASPSKLD